MIIKNKKVAIVGGGPGGLTLARLLQLKGADVTVYERDANREVRVQGSTLDLHDDSGLKALEQAGLMDAFKARYRPGADLMRVADSQANLVYDQHQEANVQAFGEAHFRPEIDRGPLRDILLDSLHPGTVVWNSHMIDLIPDGQSWLLQLKNGNMERADIVIGADGANSRIRKSVTDIAPVYSGLTMIEGTVYDSATNAPRMTELTKGGKIFALGDNKTLVTSAKGDGSLSFYTGCQKEESWIRDSGIDFNDHQQLLDWFRSEYAGWNQIWEELFNNKHTSFIPRPQYYMPLEQNWQAKDNITLIGDAAHAMPPYAGEGVNMAMQDALELCECLTGNKHNDLRSAVADYEQRMRKRAAEAAAMTLEQTAVLHAPDAINSLLRIFTMV